MTLPLGCCRLERNVRSPPQAEMDERLAHPAERKEQSGDLGRTVMQEVLHRREGCGFPERDWCSGEPGRGIRHPPISCSKPFWPAHLGTRPAREHPGEREMAPQGAGFNSREFQDRCNPRVAWYSARARAFFVWEAVTQYLTERGERATFAWLAKAAPGSRLAFTYVRKRFLTGETLYGWESGYKRFVASNLWVFGMEPQDCAAFLQGFGWRVIEDVGYDELASRYMGPANRKLTSTPVERMVYAEKS
jgi:hypothetical protein